jgi:hypothetical protein
LLVVVAVEIIEVQVGEQVVCVAQLLPQAVAVL